MVQQPSYWKVLTRRKVLSTEGGETETKLNRVLGLYDLTALGVGSTLGAGVYVLAGQIAKEQAGPSVMISFAIAALASLLAGVCYAEFGARVPKAGSAYVYSYVCIGEFAAFVIGWNLILEYVIGTAAVCRGISLYLDTLINDTLKTTFAEITPINAGFLGSYFDLFAFGLVIVFGVALAFGVETSAMANNFCTCLNISILLFVIIAGSIKANFENWSIDVDVVNATVDSSEITSDLGTGGYFPFGFSGTLRGAATCFFGFVGFDCIATTGEEVRNPRKNIPRSILLSLLVIFLCYFGVSTVLTLMVPYYRQDPNAPLPYAFKEVGWNFAMWIVAIGGLVGLLASLFGALFPLPRVMYSMAEDGLLFHFLGKVSPRFQVPVVGSIFAAVMTALIAGLFDLAQLVNLLSIGTLLAYSVVAISVTILRYMDNCQSDADRANGNHQPISETTMLTSSGSRVTFKSIFSQLFNCKRLQTPNALSTRIVGSLITIFCLLSLGIGLLFMEAYDAMLNNQVWVFVVLGLLLALTLIVLVAICLQPREIFTPRIKVFRVPFVPIVPAVSIFINIYLMLQLDPMTWIRFGIWMAIGIPIFIACYYMYNLKNPENRSPSRKAFAKALRSSGNENYDDEIDAPSNGGHQNGFLPQSLEAATTNDTLNQSKSNKSLGETHPNQLSLKSLDEIVRMSEVSEDLIEMRHPNGKVFYIEDTRSNTSTATLERDEDEGGNKMLKGSEATEEEKSAIAILDDVLQGEDDGGALTMTNNIHDYMRKFSVDSEMLPSVIETTIVATVHSSSDSSEHDLDEVPEEEGPNGLEVVNNTLAEHFEHRMECTQLAQELVDEIFENEKIKEILTKNDINNNSEEIKDEVMRKPLLQIDTKLANLERKPSEDSLNSLKSVNDPMHSEGFKSKLSKLILQPPVPVTPKPQREEISPSKETATENTPSDRPVLKHSKSEADIRRMVLKAIEGTGLSSRVNPEDRTNENEKIDSKSIPTKDNNGIPKPPKFDPILYKTVNSAYLSQHKQRPGLNDFLQDEAERGPLRPVISNGESKEVDEALPFKARLENILRRGPSHRTQKKPEVDIRSPRSKTMIEIPRRGRDSERSSLRSMENVVMPRKDDANNQVEQLIANARKSLRPVQNGAIKS